MDNRLRDLRREAEALLERIAAAEVATPGLLRPVADVQELAGHYVLEIELPGVRPGEVQVYSQRDCVVVEGIKPSPELPKIKDPMGMRGVNPSSSMTPVSYQCLERQYGPFRRIFSLPGPCDLSQSRAELSGGILTVIIPTLTEDRRNRRSSIRISARPAAQGVHGNGAGNPHPHGPPHAPQAFPGAPEHPADLFSRRESSRQVRATFPGIPRNRVKFVLSMPRRVCSDRRDQGIRS